MKHRKSRVAEMIAEREREGFVFYDQALHTPSDQQGGLHAQSSQSYIPATANEPAETRSLEPQEDLQQLFDTIVTKNYLQRLDSSTIIPLEGREPSTMSWVQITKFVYEKDTFFPDKLAMLYASLHKQSSQVALFVRYERGKGVSLYLGTRDSADTELRMSSQTLQGTLKADLPGVQYQVTSMSLADKIRPEYSLASVSGVSSLLDDKKESFLQGLERLLNAATSGCNVGSFSALLLADKVREEEVYNMVHAYERLSTELSPLAELQLNYSENKSEGVTKGITEGFNKSIATNIGETITDGTNSSSSIGCNHTETQGSNSSSSWSLLGLYSYSGGHSSSESDGTSKTETTGSSSSQSSQRGETTTKGEHQDRSESSSEQRSTGLSHQRTYKNRKVQSYLEMLDKQIKRLQDTMPFGLWSTAAYFMADSDTEAQMLSSLYRGSIIGESSGVESVAVNFFPRGKSETREALGYVSQGLHPRFLVEGINVSAGSVVTSRELAILMSLPQRSVPGVLVQERAAFGLYVTPSRPSPLGEEYIDLGYISYLGREERNSPVRLSVSELTKHTFVTGSTGSGKSNTLYLMLEQLLDQGRKMLVIEPAKGEYKHVFGNRPDVRVLGTNLKKSELLRLNPFAFPDDIAVTEHIDRLVEIFNACWPMYAAMPAVLKAAVEEAYQRCGWDLFTSENAYGLYPTMSDVLYSLREYIDKSAYSEELKSNYRGALETRLESLTRGILGEVLGTHEELSDAKLFDENVIIDLSRVGSTETKALLMGILILRLQEWRMSESAGMNSSLRHVTVIEEAHCLLKRTSTEQSSEGANLIGKSVEMITNGIAEMRTYGEGFIIVDQSPGMLDLAAIRNTNTKIVMSLPEQTDRDTAGKALGLKEEQIRDISRQSLGQAIVYQSHWEEPVQCQIAQSSQSMREEELDQAALYSYRPTDIGLAKVKYSEDVLSFLLHGADGLCYPFEDAAVRVGVLQTSFWRSRHKYEVLRALDRYRFTGERLVDQWGLDRLQQFIAGYLGIYAGYTDLRAYYAEELRDPESVVFRAIQLIYQNQNRI